MGKKIRDLTDKQQKIVKAARKNPDHSTEEIAVETDSSASYVRKVRNEHSDLIDNSSGGIGDLFLPISILVILGVVYAVENGLV